MKHKSTDHLIADVLAMGMELRKHLEDKRRRLTPLRMDALTSAVAAMHNYFMSWKAHELAARSVLGRKSERVVVTAVATRTSRQRRLTEGPGREVNH